MIELFSAAADRDAATLTGADTAAATPAPLGTVDVRRAIAAEHRRASPGRAWIYTNMIASADGGTAVGGVSGQLGAEGDKAVFGALRSMADVIVVGASTVRQERYRPPNQKPDVVAERTERGQNAHPRLAVVSRSLNLDTDLPLFQDESNRPYVVTVREASAAALSRLDGLADVLIAGTSDVDLAEAVGQLVADGAKTILSEGGPTVNGQLVAQDLIDEWNLSISPSLLGADSRRAAVGPLSSGPPLNMRLARVWSDDDYLFCRWIRDRQA